MKKVILSLAIFAASSLSMIAANNNQTNNANSNGKARTECVKGNKENKGMKAFESLNLTDAQKTKLEQLNEARRAEMQKKTEARKDNKENKKKEQLTAEQKQQRKAEMQTKRKEAKQNYLNSLKSILTPEQYTKFLENNFMMAGNHHKKDMKKGGKHGKGSKGMHAHNGKKGQKGQKGSNDKRGQRQATTLQGANV